MLDALKEQLPDYAKDLRLNLGQLERTTSLTRQQLWGTILASSLASREAEVIRVAQAAAAEHLDDAARRAASSAAAIMAMNNVYYRFVHLSSNGEYARMPARLRMQVVGNPGVARCDFELWCLAVSAINGCGSCVDSHERTVRAAGLSAEAVQDAVRIAAIIHAVAATLDAERSRHPEGAATRAA